MVSAVLRLYNTPQEVQHLFDSVRSYMIDKSVEVNISHKKLRVHKREYESADIRGLISNHGPTMIYLILKIINPATMIVVYNLKYIFEK